MTEPMIWCGTDPGLAKFGVAHLLRYGGLWRALMVKTVTTKASESLGSRLLQIRYSMLKQVAVGSPYLGTKIGYAYESQLGARMGHRERGDSSYHADLLERVIGVIWERSLSEYGSVTAEEPVEVLPAFIRKTLGLPSKATKDQVEKMVRRMVLDLPADLDSHSCDAVAIAIAGERKWALEQAVRRMAGNKTFDAFQRKLRRRARKSR